MAMAATLETLAFIIVLQHESDEDERLAMISRLLCVCKEWHEDILTAPVALCWSQLPPPSWLRHYGSCVVSLDADYRDVTEVIEHIAWMPRIHTLRNVCITMWTAHLIRHAPQGTIDGIRQLIKIRHQLHHLGLYLLLPETKWVRYTISGRCLDLIRLCAPTHIEAELRCITKWIVESPSLS